MKRPSSGGLVIRELRAADQRSMVRIDAIRTGKRKPAYWKEVLDGVLKSPRAARRVGLAAESGGKIVGYLVGEVRAFEFGSEACGWILIVEVDPQAERRGIGTSLLLEARKRFRARGVSCIRTMVRRNEVPVLSFFRANGFVGGSFVQLELNMEEPHEP
jgi:ribosomal protein S18 acetylase RimI-like enzyme